MSWKIRIALCLLFAAGFAALIPLSRAPAGDLFPEMDGCEVSRCAATSPVTLNKKVPTLLVKDRKLKLNYNVTDVGPSGISSVELWATRDGTTWQRYSNEPPPAGPLCVHVAEEGKYGFSLVVKNGLGVASAAPKTGDAPQMWVEVDETQPSVQVTDCAVSQCDSLMIGWTASDLHLANDPITISTAVSKEGPWTVVASGLANTGRYVWKMPKDVPYEFYVKVDAMDTAGNVGSDHTPRAVKVDLCQPKGAIVGIETEKKIEVKTEPAVQPVGFEFFPSR
jgi:hypothetical protein